MEDSLFVDYVADRLADLPGVLALSLGGSRACRCGLQVLQFPQLVNEPGAVTAGTDRGQSQPHIPTETSPTEERLSAKAGPAVDP
jgi:hypothetical protein